MTPSPEYYIEAANEQNEAERQRWLRAVFPIPDVMYTEYHGTISSFLACQVSIENKGKTQILKGILYTNDINHLGEAKLLVPKKFRLYEKGITQDPLTAAAQMNEPFFEKAPVDMFKQWEALGVNQPWCQKKGFIFIFTGLDEGGIGYNADFLILDRTYFDFQDRGSIVNAHQLPKDSKTRRVISMMGFAKALNIAHPNIQISPADPKTLEPLS